MEGENTPGLAGTPAVEGPSGDGEEARPTQGPEKPRGRLGTCHKGAMGTDMMLRVPLRMNFEDTEDVGL